MVKALGLLSGGLDSTLACFLMLEQGIEVVAVNFSTGFCLTDARRAVRRRKDQGLGLENEALKAGAKVRVPVHVVDISREYFQEVLLQPRHGFGAHLNPCLDCRIFMLKKARTLMTRFNADFVFTGEVIDQRPMSQHLAALRTIENETGLEGLLVRPLSANLLPPTIPEQKGWIDKSKFPGIRGRGRRIQMAMAEERNLDDYPTPAGGCCSLVDPEFAKRLGDLLTHHPVIDLDNNAILMLKIGRHFRLNPHAKLIVGREEAENLFLERHAKDKCSFMVHDRLGALAVLDMTIPDPNLFLLCASIAARYSQSRATPPVSVTIRRPEHPPGIMTVHPVKDEVLEDLRI